jgi:hypothetical protein
LLSSLNELISSINLEMSRSYKFAISLLVMFILVSDLLHKIR